MLLPTKRTTTLSLINLGLPESLKCCACEGMAVLRSRKDQAVMMQEDGREVDNPLSMGEYRCDSDHITQAVYYEEDAYLRVQEYPDAFIY